MTNPESAGSAHPARAAGIVLLGVAAVALVIGVTSLFIGGGDDQQGAQPGPQTSSATTPSGDNPSVTSPAGETTSGAAQPTTTDVPATSAPAGTTAAPTQGGQPTTTAAGQVNGKPLVRVYNNSTLAGLAARASEDVKRAGWEVAETGNYSQGQIPTTTVYFRPGTDEEASAKQLADTIKARLEPRFNGISGAHAGIIVIVTNDYRGSSGSKSGS